MKKLFLSALLAIGLGGVSVRADEVIVKVRPPRAVVEHRIAAPSHRHVWIAGYHRWDGHAYVWVPGRWDVPPRPHARWVAHRWVHRHGGYVLVEGHWR